PPGHRPVRLRPLDVHAADGHLRHPGPPPVRRLHRGAPAGRDAAAAVHARGGAVRRGARAGAGAGVSGLADRAQRYRVAVEDEMRAVVGDAPDALSRWMRYHLGWEDREGEPAGAGGKMMRPVALLLAAEVCGGAWERAVPAAAAVEILHRFTLLHDDVEDRSDTRNGRPAL